LAVTQTFAEDAHRKVVEVVSQGGGVLFVGTKPQAREPLQAEAVRGNQHYMVNRWLGGTLTNFRTVRKSIEKIRKFQEMEQEGVFQHLTKKEVLRIERERDKLLSNLEGILEMKRLPGVVFVIDVGQDSIAVDEANKLGIPVIALCDSNSNPSRIEFPIPANDDAVRSIRLFAAMIADACIEGEALRQERLRNVEETGAAGRETLADKFIDADEEEDLLSMRRVVKKVGKKDAAPAEGAAAEAAPADAAAAAPAAEAAAPAPEAEAAPAAEAPAEDAKPKAPRAAKTKKTDA
jgi:small subunit ribosomal protein S2